MRLRRVLAILVLGLCASAKGQDTYTVQPLDAPAPEGLAPPVKDALATSGGAKMIDAQGKPLAEVWVRKAVPAAGKPEGAKGTIQFPVLAEGELLGAIRFVAEGHDYRDQTIAPGVYTLRYGVQPVNGDHLGVSPYRDYALLIPAAKDVEVAALARKPLEARSAEAAGTSHPGVFMLLAAPGDAKAAPSVTRDETKNTWGASFALPLAVKGESAPSALRVQLVLVGMAM